MPRVVPSDVVRAVEKMFPEILKNPTLRPGFGVDDLPALQAIVRLVDAVPTELVRLDPAEYATLTVAVAALRGAIDMYASPATPRGHAFHIRGYDTHPIAMVYEAIKVCPDEAVADGTTPLAFITDADLRESIRLDVSAANQNLEAGEWKGSTVLAGSAVEALLLWGLQRHEQRNPGTRQPAITALRVGNTPLSGDPDANIEKWSLHEYTEVAAHLGVIKADTAAQVRIARMFRNLIHPGRIQRLGQKADRFTALSALAAVEAVARDLQ